MYPTIDRAKESHLRCHLRLDRLIPILASRKGMIIKTHNVLSFRQRIFMRSYVHVGTGTDLNTHRLRSKFKPWRLRTLSFLVYTVAMTRIKAHQLQNSKYRYPLLRLYILRLFLPVVMSYIQLTF